MPDIVKFINDLFGIDNTISAPIIITLITFFLSLILVKIGDWVKKNKERKTYRQVFILAVKRLTEQMKTQSKHFDVTSEELVFKNDFGYSFRRVQLFPIVTFEGIGYKQTVESFLLHKSIGIPFLKSKKAKKRAKALNKLWEIIHSAQYWHQKAIDDTSNFIEIFNKYNDLRNDAVEEHNKFFLNMLDTVTGIQIPYEIAEYIEKAAQIRETWVNKEDRTRADIVNDNLIQPLRRLNKIYPTIPFANQMTFGLLRADHEYTNQKNMLEFYRKQYHNYAIIFRNYAKITSKCLNMLKCYC